MHSPEGLHRRDRAASALRGVLLGALLAVAATASAVHAADDDGGTVAYELDNGLTLIVQEDHRAGVVVNMVWYAVGGSYEHRPITGISHAVEHMMFKGTETRETGEFSRLINREGGRLNAFVAQDYTGYFEELAADRLELAFELEADRMHRLVFREDEFEREMQVIHEERRQRVDDRPESLAMERFRAIAHLSNQYRDPVIGWQADLDTMELADLEQWYERWYAPGNATVVVVGAVDPEEVRALAEKYFGEVPARETEPAPGGAEVEAPGRRSMEMELDGARLPLLYMAYNVPTLGTVQREEEAYALLLAAELLDGGRSARLPERVVREQGIASVAQASYDPVARLDSVFTLVARPAGDHGRADLEEALHAELRDLREESVAEEELERAVTRLLADRVYAEDSLMGRANRLGRLEATGIGWEEAELFEKRLRSVTAGDIQEVARKYFRDDRLTVGWMEPTGERATPEDPGEGAPPPGEGHDAGAPEGGY